MSELPGGWSLQNSARPCTGTQRPSSPFLALPCLQERRVQQLAPGPVRQAQCGCSPHVCPTPNPPGFLPLAIQV